MEDTACREWKEESLNSIRDVDQLLREGSWVCRFTLNVAKRSQEGKYHVTYVVPVEYTGACIDAFDDRRGLLQALDRAAHDMIQHEDCLVAKFTNANSDTACRIKDVHTDETGSSVVVFGEGDNASNVVFPRPHCAEMQKWWDATTMAEILLSELDPSLECVSHVRGASGTLTGIRVNVDFLEKERIQWWSLPQLKSALCAGGRTNDDEHFRTYFLPVLYGIVEFLDQYSSD